MCKQLSVKDLFSSFPKHIAQFCSGLLAPERSGRGLLSFAGLVEVAAPSGSSDVPVASADEFACSESVLVFLQDEAFSCSDVPVASADEFTCSESVLVFLLDEAFSCEFLG
jgi:hypothetical protein